MSVTNSIGNLQYGHFRIHQSFVSLPEPGLFTEVKNRDAEVISETVLQFVSVQSDLAGQAMHIEGIQHVIFKDVFALFQFLDIALAQGS